MHLGRATEKARRFTREDWKSYAVLHCGRGEYAVLRLEVALNGFPYAAVRRFTWRELQPDGMVHYRVSKNFEFDKEG